MKMVYAVFEEVVRKFEEKIAVKDPEAGVSLTYGGLKARAEQIAGALKMQGVGKGDPVAIILPHGVDFIAAMLCELPEIVVDSVVDDGDF